MSPATQTHDDVVEWTAICPLTAIVPGTGVCALHDGRQVALLRTDEGVHAIDNRDPFSSAPVLSRGLIGEVDGRLYVASPIYKQRFALDDGRCLDDEAVGLDTWAVRVVGGMIELGARRAGD